MVSRPCKFCPSSSPGKNFTSGQSPSRAPRRLGRAPYPPNISQPHRPLHLGLGEICRVVQREEGCPGPTKVLSELEAGGRWGRSWQLRNGRPGSPPSRYPPESQISNNRYNNSACPEVDVGGVKELLL